MQGGEDETDFISAKDGGIINQATFPTEIIDHLAPGKALWLLCYNAFEVRALRGKWYRCFGNGHTRAIKREDYYLVSFWLGERR
jgi:hypothetical protein